MNLNFEDIKRKIIDFFQKYWIPVVGAVIILAVILSCINIYRERVLNVDGSGKYEAQDTIYLPANSMDTLNPIKTITEDSYYLNKLIYDGLFDFNDDLSVKPKLVKSYTVNTEKSYIDIKLKTGIKFHDGKTLTAKDIKFTVDAIKSQGKTSLYYEKVSKIYSVNLEKDKDYELRIYFKDNYDCALDNLTFPIVSSNQHNSVSAFLKDEKFTPVGTGMYKVESYDQYKELKLIPNTSYFDGVAKNNIVAQIIPDKSNLANLIENGMITCYLEKGSDRRTTVTDNDFKMYDIVSNEVDFIYFNTSGIFKETNMRKAVCYAIDSESVLEKGYMNDGILTDTIYFPNFLGVKEEGKSYKFDIDKTAMLLAKEGYVDEDMDGIYEDEKKKPLNVTILVNSDNANRIAAAKVISSNLQKAGFNTTVNSVPWEEYEALIKRKSFDILVTGYMIEESYDLTSLFNGKALWGYENEEIFNKARELERLYDQSVYSKKYEELKDLLIEEVPYYPLCYKKMGLIGAKTLDADNLPMFNNYYRNIETWKWSKLVSNEE